jgi:thiol-disulfide isomerase/thioredoxin
MKNLFIWMLSLCAVATASAQYNVSGEIKGHDGQVYLLALNTLGKNDTIGSVTAKDGKFAFTGKVAKPTTASVRAAGTRIAIPLFLESAKYTISADASAPQTYTVTGGGKLQGIYKEYRAQRTALMQQRDSIVKLYDIKDPEGRKKAEEALEPLTDKFYAFEDQFISSNDNQVGAYVMLTNLSSYMQQGNAVEMYDKLGENARNSIEGQYMKKYVDRLRSLAVGNVAPNLIMTTPDGGELAIHDVKGKVKVLDFWASWCGPCRREIPNVKRMYEKYHDQGLEILGLSLDNDKDAWIKAIKDENLPWLHVSDLKGWESIAAQTYSVQSIPAVYVLDADNKIIATGLRGEALEEFVAKTLGAQ